jgi:hypothetical protein
MEEQTAAYIDEEDCLGFKIWVAELELIVGSSRGKKKADPTQAFLLLQKLVTTLDRTDRKEVREYQRRCEDALIDILLKGAPPPVRLYHLSQTIIAHHMLHKKETFTILPSAQPPDSFFFCFYSNFVSLPQYYPPCRSAA